MQLVQRRNLFHKQEVLALRDDSIEILRDGRVMRSIPYEDVACVRLAFVGANVSGGQSIPTYACVVRSRRGQKLKLLNTRFEGPGQVSVHDEPYDKFIRLLHKRLLPYRDRIRFVQGSTWYYLIGWAGIIMCLLLLLLVPLTLMIDGGAMLLLRKAWVLAMMPVLLAATFVPLILRGRSAVYDPSDLSVKHLP